MMAKAARWHWALTITSALLLSACSGFQSLPGRGSYEASIVNNPDVRSRLYQEFEAWRGTPHALGGLSKRGIDCSGLVYLTFRNEFGEVLPRSTRRQATQGVPVRKRNLRSGDLVFFDTGMNSRHVGIYIEQDKFLHVSSSRGVMVSYLSQGYWGERFTHARRIQITLP